MTTTLTCKIGKFTFEEDVTIALAKLVRDTVVGQMLAPKRNTPLVETEEDAYSFMRTHESAVLQRTIFEVEFNEEHKSHQLESLLQALAEQARVTSKEMNELSSRFSLTYTQVHRALNRYRMLAKQGVFV